MSTEEGRPHSLLTVVGLETPPPTTEGFFFFRGVPLCDFQTTPLTVCEQGEDKQGDFIVVSCLPPQVIKATEEEVAPVLC